MSSALVAIGSSGEKLVDVVGLSGRVLPGSSTEDGGSSDLVRSETTFRLGLNTLGGRLSEQVRDLVEELLWGAHGSALLDDDLDVVHGIEVVLVSAKAKERKKKERYKQKWLVKSQQR